MRRIITILLLVGLSFALGACKKSTTTKPDEPLVEETTEPVDEGVAPNLRHASGWLPPDTMALGGVSVAPFHEMMREGLPADSRDQRYAAIIADLGELFEDRTGLDWTRLDAVAVGYGSSWSGIFLYGDFSVEGIKTGTVEVSGQQVIEFDLGGSLQGFLVELDGPLPGYVAFENQEHVEAALAARSEAGDAAVNLQEAADSPVQQLLTELPPSHVMAAATMGPAMLAGLPPQVQQMAPKHGALAIGSSSAILLRGEDQKLDALRDFVGSFIEQAEATASQQYEARDALPMAEATGAILGYHFVEAYIESLEIERGAGTLNYRIDLPISQLGLALPGIGAAIAIPAFQRYITASKTSEADGILQRMSLSAIKSFERTRAETGTGAFPGAPGTVVRSHPEAPVGGENLLPNPVVEFGNADAAALLQDLGVGTRDPLYFQYSYQVEGSGADARAVVSATADFKPGGRMHTVQIEIAIEPQTGTPYATPAVVMNEYE